jgi:hypothetical protein
MGKAAQLALSEEITKRLQRHDRGRARWNAEPRLSSNSETP